MNKPLSLTAIALLVTALFATSACAEKPAAEAASSAANKPAAQGAVYPADKRAPIEAALAAYEGARGLFVADKLEGIEAAAKAMKESATSAAAAAPDDAKPHLTGLIEAAGKLEVATKEGIEPARKAYGEVSKHVVGLLVSFPSLTEGRFVFQCPMAPGYKKWVQTSDKLQNPYMGQRMPACGGATDWKV